MDCEFLLDTAFQAKVNDGTLRELRLFFFGQTVFAGPTPLARCLFRSRWMPSVDDFTFYSEANYYLDFVKNVQPIISDISPR